MCGTSCNTSGGSSPDADAMVPDCNPELFMITASMLDVTDFFPNEVVSRPPVEMTTLPAVIDQTSLSPSTTALRVFRNKTDGMPTRYVVFNKAGQSLYGAVGGKFSVRLYHAANLSMSYAMTTFSSSGELLTDTSVDILTHTANCVVEPSVKIANGIPYFKSYNQKFGGHLDSFLTKTTRCDCDGASSSVVLYQSQHRCTMGIACRGIDWFQGKNTAAVMSMDFPTDQTFDLKIGPGQDVALLTLQAIVFDLQWA